MEHIVPTGSTTLAAVIGDVKFFLEVALESVRTTLRVLETVAERPGIGVSEIARFLDIPKTTAHRSLATLREAGYIRPAAGGKRAWQISTRMMLLCRISLEPQLREAALPKMRELRDLTGETIHLMVPEGGEVVLIERIDSLHPVRTVRQLGSHAPLHIASNGKAALAAMSDDECQAYLRSSLQRWTERSMTSREQILAEIQKIRVQGYAVSLGELDLSVHAVAAAILDNSNRPVGTLSISCPASRLPVDLVPEYGAYVSAAARDISSALNQ